MTTKLIVIDPGHDVDDQGSRQFDGQMENEFTLALARATRDRLLELYDCRVVLTHDGPGMVPRGDLDAELRARGQLPNTLKADFFLSLHHNWGPIDARGAEYYIHTDRRAADNGLAWLPAVDSSGHQNHAAPRSYEIARRLVPTLADALGTLGIPWRGEPGRIMCADFAVLRYPQLPCGLVETHFGSSPADDAIANRPDFIPGVANGIALALGKALDLPIRS